MRVIAGTARSTPLCAPSGLDTRPTTDRIKETLFNVLQFSLQGRVFLDLFAGSGAMGIEAVSRGAEKAIFMDNAKEAVSCIEKNIRKCHFEVRTEVYRTEVLSGLSRIANRADIKSPLVFLDPPYDRGLEFPVLKQLSALSVVDEDSLIVVETSLRGDLSEAERYGYEIYREKAYKNQKHVFLRLRKTEA